MPYALPLRTRENPVRPVTGHWDTLTNAALLNVRLCDLGVVLGGELLASSIGRLLKQLAERRVRVRPHFWLSDEWMTPDNCIGIGIPFYLAHPRLMHLERRQLLEVEGGTPRTAGQLLKHEMGHVVCNAYQLHRRASWRRIFGSPSLPYPKVYHPNPQSRHYVQHLPNWYAQCHPDEDWAETFAVWLSPKALWRKRYQGWGALKKLEYVDSLMHELAGQPPRVRTRTQPYALKNLKHTLREHYIRKKERYGLDFPVSLEPQLLQVFPPSHGGRRAANFLRSRRQQILRLARQNCRAPQALSPMMLEAIVWRCQELGLAASGPSTLLTERCAELARQCADTSRLARGYFAV